MRYSGPTARKGFTLFEILVVLLVLALLAGLAFPALRGARESGRTAGCAGKLMQIGFALSQYVEDTGGRYPSVFPPSRHCTWADRITPYVQQTSAFECPSDPTAEYRVGCPAPDFSGTEPLFFHGSYSINYYLHQASRRNFTHPESTVVVIDGKESPTHIVQLGQAHAIQGTDIVGSGISVRHHRGANLLFADKHVKWLRLETFNEPRLWFVGAVPTPTPATP